MADDRSFDNPLDARTPSAGGGPLTPNTAAIDRAGVYGGAKDPQMPDAAPYLWKCPTCRTEYATPLSSGCPRCQPTIEAERLAAEQARTQAGVDEATLLQAILRVPTSGHARQSLRAMGLTMRARRTLYRALASYAEQRANPDDLPRGQVLGWARLLSQAEAEESGETK